MICLLLNTQMAIVHQAEMYRVGPHTKYGRCYVRSFTQQWLSEKIKGSDFGAESIERELGAYKKQTDCRMESGG